MAAFVAAKSAKGGRRAAFAGAAVALGTLGTVFAAVTYALNSLTRASVAAVQGDHHEV
jgi:hypothetical protein